MKIIVEFYHEKQMRYVRRTLWGSFTKPDDGYITKYVQRYGGDGTFTKTYINTDIKQPTDAGLQKGSTGTT